MKSQEVKKSYIQNEFYDKVYQDPNWEDLRKKDAKQILSKLELQIHKDAKVIDIGCGSGCLGNEIIQKYGCLVDGVDINEVSVEISRKKGLNVLNFDLDSKWGLASESYDFVFSTEMIEHVINTDLFIEESKRILKKGGKLVLTTPNLTCWYNRLLFIFGYQPFFTEVSIKDKTFGLDFTRKLTPNRAPVGHIRVFSHRAIKDMLEYYGFKNVKIIGLKILYIHGFMKFIDDILSNISWLSSDLLIIAEKE